MNLKRMRVVLVVCSVVLIPNVAIAFYAPHLGRFTSRDPIADRIGGTPLANRGTILPRDMPTYDGGTVVSMTPSWDRSPQDDGNVDGYNLYQYVRSNPIAHSDPTGLIPSDFNPPRPIFGPGEAPSDGTPCGNLTIQCASGPKSWPVYGDSDKAGGILRPIGGSGCVTLVGPNRIICTGGCQAIKKWGSGGKPSLPILDHEGCHACAFEDGGAFGFWKYCKTAIWDNCDDNPKKTTPGW